jgi:hypothetical protein
MKGYVYILTNPSMPGIVKIGRTTRSVHGRAGELYQTGVPTPFEVAHYIATPDCVDLERRMHALFAEQRVGSDREFFSVEAGYAGQCLAETQREQIETIVDEYLPGQTLTDAEFFVDPGEFALLCHNAGVGAEAFSMSIEYLSHDAIRAAIAMCAGKRPWLSDRLVATNARPEVLN